MTPEQLKASILQYAIQGKLVEQRPEEGTGEELYQKMQTDKQTLIREKKIKKEKPLPDIIDNEIPFDVPESWKWVKVGNVGSWSSGATPSRTNPAYYGGSIPWLKTGDLNDGFIQEVPEYITDLALEKTSLRLNPIGSVLMAMYGATIGKLGILEIPVTTNQACCACIPYAGMNNKYLFYYLMSMRQSYIGMAEGGAQPNISKEKIVNSLIPLPPAEEQRRIVAKIEELLPYVDRYAAAYEKFVQIYDLENNDNFLCGKQEKCANCGIKNYGTPLYPIYYSDTPYDATKFAKFVMLRKIAETTATQIPPELYAGMGSALWEQERTTLIKKECHKYDEEWRMITGCIMKPPVMMEWIPSGIILGLRMDVAEENLVVSMAKEAGIKNIYKSYINAQNKLDAYPLKL